MIRIQHLKYIYNLKLIFKLSIFTVIIVIISACNSGNSQQSVHDIENDHAIKQAFLIGSGPNSKRNIKDMIEKSGIRNGGYVVIIPTSFMKNDSNAYFLKREFYEQKIFAVHILGFHQDSAIKNTDVIAIENANILCLTDGRRNKFINLANSTRLKNALLNAYDNGTLVVGNGKAAALLGEKYYSWKTDTILNSKKIILKPGLGILQNTVIDDFGFFRNHKETIQQESTKKNFVFLGLDYKASIWIKNGDAFVLRKSGIGIISPDKPVIILHKGDEFKLI